MTTDDGLLSGADSDAFALGATDEDGMRRDGELGERARRMLRDRLAWKRIEDEA